MKLIPLTQGKFAQVDDEDYEWLNQWKWTLFKMKTNNYAYRRKYKNGKYESILMHRQILGLTEQKILGDHENNNGLDNQRVNLRKSTAQQNSMNRRSRKNSTSKYLGVSICKVNKNGKIYKYWKCQIKNSKKVIHLGYFKNEEDAAKCYNESAIKYHKAFANINII